MGHQFSTFTPISDLVDMCNEYLFIPKTITSSFQHKKNNMQEQEIELSDLHFKPQPDVFINKPELIIDNIPEVKSIMLSDFKLIVTPKFKSITQKQQLNDKINALYLRRLRYIFLHELKMGLIKKVDIRRYARFSMSKLKHVLTNRLKSNAKFNIRRSTKDKKTITGHFYQNYVQFSRFSVNTLKYILKNRLRLKFNTITSLVQVNDRVKNVKQRVLDNILFLDKRLQIFLHYQLFNF